MGKQLFNSKSKPNPDDRYVKQALRLDSDVDAMFFALYQCGVRLTTKEDIGDQYTCAAPGQTD